MKAIFLNVKNASIELPLIAHEIKQRVVIALADKLLEHTQEILNSNQLDLNKMDESDPKYDRLLLNPKRINDIAQSLKVIAKIESPIWKVLEDVTLPNGLHLQKLSVPLGVIGIIFEARPNVILEAFVLCLMSSNACILKGGVDAKNTNTFFAKLIQQTLIAHDLPVDCMVLMPHEREAVLSLLKAKDFVDLIIPRGSQGLIDYVKQNTAIPIIETGAGVVHVYVDSSADISIASQVIDNAKTRRVSVCNALDCLIVHEAMLKHLPELVANLKHKNVHLLADERSKNMLLTHYPSALLGVASIEDYGKEFLSLTLAIKTVADLQQALAHIRQFSSKHSEAIIAQDENAIAAFFKQVDAAVLYANASTAFTDGGEFGMGGEIGISTQKLHVRGPFSLQHLVSTKWTVTGHGQVRA